MDPEAGFQSEVQFRLATLTQQLRNAAINAIFQRSAESVALSKQPACLFQAVLFLIFSLNLLHFTCKGFSPANQICSTHVPLPVIGS